MKISSLYKRKKPKMKIFVIGDERYADWILFEYEIISKIREADLVILTGGEDVSPDMYGEKPIPKTNYNPKRDFQEDILVSIAITNKIPIVGICRGAQFLTVKAGGKLIQNVNNHAIGETHKILTNTGDIYEITSTHHQMMNHYNLIKEKYRTLAISYENLSDIYETDKGDIKMDSEPEIVYYPEIRGLAIQGHPEIMDKKEPVVEYLNRKLKELCLS